MRLFSISPNSPIPIDSNELFITFIKTEIDRPSQHLPFQSQQWKHQNYM